jgi:3-hydroxypropanoate dehydrogenase
MPSNRTPIADAVARKRARALSEDALGTLLIEARTARAYLPEPVTHEVLKRLVDLVELGQTSSNTLPMRLVFVESREAKDRLRPALSSGNVEKTMQAPVTAIIAADLHFYFRVPGSSEPNAKLVERFGQPDNAQATREFAIMQATLQGAYLHLAARALGLDPGPMGGFDRSAVDAAFFPDGRLASIWLVNLGYGDDAKLPPRAPRYTFDEVASIV